MSSKEPHQPKTGEPASCQEQPKADLPGETAGGEESLESEVSRVRGELETAKDLMLRTRAELDNYQKRVARQLDEERKFANVPLLRDLLPVLDNIQRAIEAAEKTADAESLLNGFKMVKEQLDRVLERNRCLVIDALHQKFDPHQHEAVMQQPSAEFPANTVLHVLQNGYQLHDRVVRPSQVIVSSAVPGAGRHPGGTDGEAAD
jgi:molecular chaperone GrpE